jgi:hypothetical protein
MSQKKEQKTAEKPSAGPLRKHRTRAEKIDDLKKQISELRKAEREERQKARDEKLLAIGKAVYEKQGSQRIFMACNSLWNQKNLKWILKTISNYEGAF